MSEEYYNLKTIYEKMAELTNPTYGQMPMLLEFKNENLER